MKTMLHGLFLASAVMFGVPALAEDLVIGSRTEPAALDPHYLWNPVNNQLAYHYLGYMARTGPDGGLIPSLGTSWEATGETEWVFHIDPAANFANGAPVTAADFIASYERAINMPNGTYKSLFAPVKGFEAVDDKTLKVITTTPYPTLPFALSQVAVIPASVAATAKAEDFTKPDANISAGPYIFTEYVPGDRLVLVPNPGYSGTHAKWDNLTFRFLTDNAARVAALLSGTVDMVDGVAPDDAIEIAKRDGFTVVTEPSERAVYMTFDFSRDVTPQATALDGSPLPTNPFFDRRVRQAMAYAINRDAIIDRVLLGQGFAMNQIGSPNIAGFNPEIPVVPFDPDAAKALLAEAGYPDGFALTVSCFSGRLVNDARVCQAIGQMLERVGIKMTVDVQPYQVLLTKNICHCDDMPSFFMSTWSSAYAGELGASLSNVARSYDPVASKASWNLGEYSNPTLDALIETAAQTNDAELRHRLQAEAMAIAMEDVFVLPLHLQGVALAARKGLTPTPFSNEYTLADYVMIDG